MDNRSEIDNLLCTISSGNEHAVNDILMASTNLCNCKPRLHFNVSDNERIARDTKIRQS